MSSDKLPQDQENYLIHMASNRTQSTYPQTKRDREKAAHLLCTGYIHAPIAKIECGEFYPRLLPYIAYKTKFQLTDKGKQYLLSLNPENFANNDWWPLPIDIINIQKRLNGS